VLHEDELALAPRLCPQDDLQAAAILFAAKEAAFKACAAPLRRWYEGHDEQLVFDLRHFVMREPGSMSGDGRNGAAQHALERMGIHIRVHHTCIAGHALVVALALAR
jgi:4'-phosphopantetheinyl transferase EntD